jgi:subtilase family serine protease
MRTYLWAALAAVVVLLLVPAAFADPGKGRSALNGTVPPWATAANLKNATPSSDAVGFRIYLGLRNSDQAEALARAVADPSSSSFGKFLTPGAFRSSFAPSQADVNVVRAWLQGQGFSIAYTPTNNHYVAAEGSAAQVEAAFGVKLNEYSVNGLTLRAPASELTIPASLSASVVSVLGIDQSSALIEPLNRRDANAPPAAGFRNAPPCSEYWAQKLATTLPTYDGQTLPYAPCGYTPPQLREAYGADSVHRTNGSVADGAGVTVAVIDAYASPTIEQDVNQYIANHDPSNTLKPGQFTQVVAPGTYGRPENPAQDPQGWYGEETLDVEAVHAMAPGANIVYVGAPNNYRDLDAAVNHVVDRRLADIVTNSYGFSTEFLPSGYIKPLNDTFIQAALQGMTILFSSGDNGDEIATHGYRTTDWPASSPWVTAVGGTSLAAGQAVNRGQYLFETGWSTTRNRLNCDGTLKASNNAWCAWELYLYGSGGGASRLFAQPSWQQGVVPTSIAQPAGFTPAFTRPGRAVPDISAVGDPNTGMLIGQSQTFLLGGGPYGEYRIGGTSLSSPLMAGMFALAADRKGSALGFVNPLLYGSLRSQIRDVPELSPSTTKGVVRVDYVNGENDANGLLYSVRTLGFHTSAREIRAPAFPNGDYNTTIWTRNGYDDVTGLGSPTATFLTALGG